MDCSILDRSHRPPISIEDMRAIEVNASWHGITVETLMENAGRSVADVVECLLDGVANKRVDILAGRGGNGGDGFVLARHLASRGARVRVHLAYPPDMISHKASIINYRILESTGLARIVKPWGRGWLHVEDADVVVDALLGFGVRGSLRSPVKEAVEAYNKSQGLRVSIDTPTGVNPDTGDIAEGAAVADVTVTLHAPKRGLLVERARLHVGRLIVTDIGIPRPVEEIAGPGDVAARIPPRPPDAHKGMGGRVLIVGGSRDYIGAPILASIAAAYAGADLVYIASPKFIAYEAASKSSTIIPIPLESDYLDEEGLRKVMNVLSKANSVLVGPGLGATSEALESASRLIDLTSGKPVVVDADGLKALKMHGRVDGVVIATPHRGEALMLLDAESGEPRMLAERVAREYNATVLLKAPVDYICSPQGDCRYNRTGSPSMSVGGTGDVLSGIIAAFMARRTALGLDPEPLHVAAAAAYVSGRAGELAVEELGENITAFDVAAKINAVISEARSFS
ncbi:MAG: NAD(P)H-hydrate dehydratase [Desulfurococcales archaeon]|nr:NAD(P)H-hydrate dehydratase [Desulfurococcales archaeon]